MKFGIMFANVLFGDGEGAKAVATAADDLGFESIWTVEHVAVPKDYQSPYPYSPSGKMGGPDDMSIPIHIGGRTARPARPAGEIGDGFFPGAQGAVLPHSIEHMRRCAEKAGRDPESTEVTAGGAMAPAGVETLGKLGVSRVV